MFLLIKNLQFSCLSQNRGGKKIEEKKTLSLEEHLRHGQGWVPNGCPHLLDNQDRALRLRIFDVFLTLCCTAITRKSKDPLFKPFS